jgi:hypothetical protein
MISRFGRSVEFVDKEFQNSFCILCSCFEKPLLEQTIDFFYQFLIVPSLDISSPARDTSPHRVLESPQTSPGFYFACVHYPCSCFVSIRRLEAMPALQLGYQDLVIRYFTYLFDFQATRPIPPTAARFPSPAAPLRSAPTCPGLVYQIPTISR